MLLTTFSGCYQGLMMQRLQQ